jgi:hypothetical protein
LYRAAVADVLRTRNEAKAACSITLSASTIRTQALKDRLYEPYAAPVGAPWMRTLAFGHPEDRTPTYGYEPTREVAMAAFAKRWRREETWPGEQTHPSIPGDSFMMVR